MYPIRLEKFTLVAEAIEQKRHQLETVAFGQLRVNILKLLRVGYAIIGRQLHPGQQDRGFASLACFNNRFKVVTYGVDRCSTQSVIAAKLENDDIRTMRFKRLFNSGASARSGFTAHARIDQARLRLSLQPSFQQTDPSRILRQAIAGRQTVAEYHNSSGTGRGCGQCRHARVGERNTYKNRKYNQEFFHDR